MLDGDWSSDVCSSDLDLPPVHADGSQLELAIVNLVLNARDAMPEGGVIVIGAEERAASEGGDLVSGRYVRISVSDTGQGMDDATMRQAIEPFFTTKGVDKGTGLGLSMVHGFAAQSGGVLRLSSKIGIGTIVEIWLPVGRAMPAPSPVPEPVPSTDQPEPDARLLLVDDDDRVRLAAAEMLRELGYHVIEANSAGKALAVLSRDRAIDAVVTDYLMPEQSGADLIRMMRLQGCNQPVLIVTGFINAAADLPANMPRLNKPFRAAELASAVSELLRPRAAAS
jgi:CheY-like chemotaxis protein